MTQETVNLIGDLVKTVGFPIFVAIWLLYRTDQKIDKGTEVMSEVAKNLAELIGKGEHR